MAPVRVILAVSDDAALDVVARDAAQAGLTDARAMPSLRLLQGMIAPERIAALRALPGVASVEPERQIALPPAGQPQ